MLDALTAVILAGGLGTRLKSAVPDLPKALAPILGKPFLSYLLRRLELAGIQRVVICTGFGADHIEQTFGRTFGKLRLEYSRESSPLGTAGALRLALPLLDSEWVITFNGDSFADVDLNKFFQWHTQQAAAASIALADLPDTSRFGTVKLNGQHEIISFVEKAGIAEPGLINAGIYLLDQKSISAIPPGRSISIEREVFPSLIKHGLHGYRGCRRFIDIGTPESYRDAEQFFRGEPA